MDIGEDEIKVNGLTGDDIVLLRVGEFRAAEVINEPLLDLLVLGHQRPAMRGYCRCVIH